MVFWLANRWSMWRLICFGASTKSIRRLAFNSRNFPSKYGFLQGNRFCSADYEVANITPEFSCTLWIPAGGPGIASHQRVTPIIHGEVPLAELFGYLPASVSFQSRSSMSMEPSPLTSLRTCPGDSDQGPMSNGHAFDSVKAFDHRCSSNPQSQFRNRQAHRCTSSRADSVADVD